MRASQGDRDDYQRMRDLDEQERRARRELIDGYLRIPAAGLARAVVESEGFNAIVALRKVNKVLRENGFEYPLGAQGVEDLITHLGVAQLHEDQLPLVLEMAEHAMENDDRFSGQEYRDVVHYLRHAAGEEGPDGAK